MNGQSSNGSGGAYNNVPNRDPAVNVNRSQRMTFVVPFILSVVFYIADCLHVKTIVSAVPEGTYTFLRIIELLADISLGYFPVTLISMVTAAFLQQLLYKVSAGLDETKIERLFIFFIVYIVDYTIYLATKGLQWMFLMYITLGLTVWFGVWIWQALDGDVRNATTAQSRAASSFTGEEP